MNDYDVALICANGHVINSAARDYPQHNTKFCTICGTATITNCPNCNAEIPGYYHMDDVIGFDHYTAPAFCHNCGKAYPWTETKITIAKEYAAELNTISREERQILTDAIDELVEDSPKTILAAARVKNIIANAGSQADYVFRDILIDIVNETAQKIIWP